MGYTHYMPQKRAFTLEEWNTITGAVKKLFTGSEQIAGGDGSGLPIVNESEICFNGVAERNEDHETFVITREHMIDFNFCKTASKPYDRFVTAVLTIAYNYAATALAISSDGSEKDWLEGLRMAQSVCDDPIDCPIQDNP